jgi:hypothetical protein
MTPAEREAVRSYWTPERIMATRWLDLQSAPFSARSDVARNRITSPRGDVKVTGATLPGQRSRTMTLPAGSDLSLLTGGEGIQPQAGNGSPGWGGAVNEYPAPFTRSRLFPDLAVTRQTFPHRAVGILVFTIPGEGDFRCTASVLSSLNNSTLWTAGHCVATPGVGFHTNFLFVPAWHGSVASGLGLWTGTIAVTFTDWIANGCLEFDMGTVIVQNDGGGIAPFGIPISNVTGGFGFASNLSPLQNWTAMGLPAANQLNPHPPGPDAHRVPGPAFDGNHLEICNSQEVVDGTVTCDGNFVMGIGCDQTGGSSGGPWVLDYTGNGDFLRNLVNGHNSFKFVCDGDPGCGPFHTEMEMYGPYFGSGAQGLKEFSEGFDPSDF